MRHRRNIAAIPLPNRPSMSSAANREDEEFMQADAMLHQTLPVYDQEPMIKPDQDGDPHLMYWCRGTVYRHRRLTLANDPHHATKVTLCVRDHYLVPSTTSLGSGSRAWDASLLFARWVYLQRHLVTSKVVMELGAGSCGLPGMAASLFAKEVYLTEKVPRLLENIRYNMIANNRVLTKGNVKVEHLDWDQPTAATSSSSVLAACRREMDVLLACEVLYDAMDPTSLVDTIRAYLKPDGVMYLAVVTEARGSNAQSFDVAVQKLGYEVKRSPLDERVYFSGEEEISFGFPKEALLLYQVQCPAD